MKVRSKASLRSATSLLFPLPLLSPLCQLKQHFGKVQAGSRRKRRCCWAEGPSPQSCCCPSRWALWKSCGEPGARRAWEENRPSFPRMMNQDHGGDSSEIYIGRPILGGGGRAQGRSGCVKGLTDLSGRKWWRRRVSMFPLQELGG